LIGTDCDKYTQKKIEYIHINVPRPQSRPPYEKIDYDYNGISNKQKEVGHGWHRVKNPFTKRSFEDEKEEINVDPPTDVPKRPGG
jgi:hypothetical protein